jgi:hypothetical protein
MYFLLLCLWKMPATLHAQFTYTTNNGAITLTKYTGSEGSVVISNFVTGIGDKAFYMRSVTNVTIPNSVITIGSNAFEHCLSLASATIGKNVTHIGDNAFYSCPGLRAITVDNNNSVYSSVDGVLFYRNQATLIKCPEGKTGSVTVPKDITMIESCAFLHCMGLTNIIIPNTLLNIGNYAFAYCYSLTGVYFYGNAPGLNVSVFSGDTNATIYVLPGTLGWHDLYLDRPIASWFLPYPLILPSTQYGECWSNTTNRFDFFISWATNATVVVEACTNLTSHIWIPVSTNTLAGGTSYFSYPDWRHPSTRYYRIRFR